MTGAQFLALALPVLQAHPDAEVLAGVPYDAEGTIESITYIPAIDTILITIS